MWHNDLMSILYFNVVVLLFERYRGDVLIYSFFFPWERERFRMEVLLKFDVNVTMN